MRELTYTILELEKGSKRTCDFCSNLYGEDNKSVNQVITRIKASGKYVADSVVCEECKEKFENDELLKCERCGRLQTKSDFDFCSHKYICDCVRYNENLEEKEISASPPRESMSSFYERQINKLQEEKTHLATEAQSHLDAMEAFEVYNKKHKQELLDEIAKLKKENTAKEERIRKLEEQLAQLSSQQQTTAQIEVKTE